MSKCDCMVCRDLEKQDRQASCDHCFEPMGEHIPGATYYKCLYCGKEEEEMEYWEPLHVKRSVPVQDFLRLLSWMKEALYDPFRDDITEKEWKVANAIDWQWDQAVNLNPS